MKKFEICYELDRERVLVPDLLAVGESQFEFDYKNSLRFIIEYDFLPKSVMPRFIVRRHKDIKEGLQWRTGVVLEDMVLHSTALVKSDDRDRKIYIYVNGEQKRDFFAVIRKTLQYINGSFEKLETTELVPLPDDDKITVEYEELIGHEQMGTPDIIVGKLTQLPHPQGQFWPFLEFLKDKTRINKGSLFRKCQCSVKIFLNFLISLKNWSITQMSRYSKKNYQWDKM